MIKQRGIWVGGVLALLAVWAVAAGAIWFARSQRVTAEKITAYAQAHPLPHLPAAERLRVIESLADRVNRLSFEERQKFRHDRELRRLFEEMTDAERARYLDLTLPKGMQQMMEAFNTMPPAQRKQLVNRALADLGRLRAEAGPKDQQDIHSALSDQSVQRIINQGLKSYLSDANAETKLDLQPLIEEMQNIMQSAR